VPRFHIINFGCRANQADGAVLEQQFTERGFDAAGDHRNADVVVLNSCTVTSGADHGVRQIARQVRRANPEARIVVTGCYAQRCPEELALLPGVEYVVGNSHKVAIVDLLSSDTPAADHGGQCTRYPENQQFVPLGALANATASQAADEDVTLRREPGASAKILLGDIFAHQELLAAPVVGGAAHERTRPNLKIQDGCNNRCSFCVIPYVRGRSRSLSLAEILHQVRLLCETGYKEVVLSGINLGRYGRDFGAGKLRLAQALQAILNETPLERLRLSSVEPMDFTNELLDLMARSPRIAKHVHAPLQSGSDRILRRMRRKYHPHHYRARIEAAFERMPNAAFGADVMVGFPGESDHDFEETLRFIDSLPFTYLHVFPFSRRPGTPADKMPDQVHGGILRKRARMLRELGSGKNLRFREKQIGRELDVVTLDGPPDGKAQGTAAISDHFLDVWIPGERLPGNRMLKIRVAAVSPDGLIAETSYGNH